MQSVIAQARATPMTKPPASVIEQSYPSNPVEQQQDQNGANVSKLPSANAISSILAEFQAKAAQQQQMQQQASTMDQTNALLMAAAQNGNSPLAIQQLLAALNEKQPGLGSPHHHHQQQQQQHAQFPFQMPAMPNALQQYLQTSNGSLNPQVILNQSERKRDAMIIANKSFAHVLRFAPEEISLVQNSFEIPFPPLPLLSLSFFCVSQHT